MRNGRVPILAFAASLILGATSIGPTLAQKGGGDPTVTLTLAVADPGGRQSEPAVLDLVRLADELSGGMITIEPVFNAGDDTPQGFEHGVVELVKAGDFDLGVASTRAFDLAGVTSLQAFQAPLLIDNDALALAVARSGIADRALASMGQGITGLAMWPEDLRHLFAFPPGGRVFRTPADVSGATILVIPSAASQATVTALGGELYQEGVAQGAFEGERGTDAASGALAGMETGLWGAGLPRNDAIAVGDVVLFPKYQALVGNDAALNDLTDDQRAILDEAVRQMREAAFGRQFSETELGAAHCASGGSIVLAGAGASAAFLEAARPARETLEADPLTAGLIADIEALKAATAASPLAPACSYEALSEGLVGAPTGFLDTLPPDGTYRVELTREDLLQRGATPKYAAGNAQTWTLTIAGDRWSLTGSNDEACAGTITSPDTPGVRFETTESLGCGFDYDFAWREAGDGIELWVLAVAGDPDYPDMASERAANGRVWTRIEGSPAVGDPTAEPEVVLPPDGVYRAQITTEDLLAAGAVAEEANALQGVVTWTLDAGAFSMAWDTGIATADDCHGTYAVSGDAVRFTFEDGDVCWAWDELRMTPVDGGLDVQFVRCGLNPSGYTTLAPGECNVTTDRALFARVWTRIGDAATATETSATLPPDGVYRMTLTLEEALGAGAARNWAINDLAGTHTLEISGGQGVWR